MEIERGMKEKKSKKIGGGGIEKEKQLTREE